MEWINILQKLDIAARLIPLIYAPDEFRLPVGPAGRSENNDWRQVIMTAANRSTEFWQVPEVPGGVAVEYRTLSSFPT